MNDETRYEFSSVEWVTVAREHLQDAARDADLSDVHFTFNEVFTDAPAHLGTDAEGRIGWYVRVRDGRIEVERGILDEADLRIVADYQTVLPLARMVFAGDEAAAAEAGRKVAEATEAGRCAGKETTRRRPGRLGWAECTTRWPAARRSRRAAGRPFCRAADKSLFEIA